jgi:hypothetical protein
MTKAQQPAELREAFVTDEEQRLLEIEEMRLVVKFGEKKRYPHPHHTYAKAMVAATMI